MRQTTRKIAAFLIALLSILPIVLHGPRARAEQIGEMRFSDFLLEPSFQYNEGRRGSFSPGNSYLAGDWHRDSALSARLKVGSRDLLGVPAVYASTAFVSALPAQANTPALVEAFGQVETTYGRFRMGLIPIAFSLDGGDSEARLRFPRSLFFENRLVALRDVGLSYHIDNEGFFSDWAVHNGEAGADLDNELWFTARWGYRSGHDLQVGFSGSTGRTSPLATAPSGLTLSSKTRLANFFFAMQSQKLSFEFEGATGEVRTDAALKRLRSGHVDVDLEVESQALILARYDFYDPDVGVNGDQTQMASLGLAFRSKYETSSFYLIGSKVWREGVPQAIHQGMVIWRLTPVANPRRM
jgi:hypothetical protein